MTKKLSVAMILGGAWILGAFGMESSSQALPTAAEIIARNIQAAGGREKLSGIKNLSFKSGSTKTFVSSNSEMKILTGKDPVVTEAILVKGDSAKRNAFNDIREITGIRKASYLAQARLFAGLFSLAKFEGRLTLAGLKTYGPEKLFDLTTDIEGLKIDFFVRDEDYLLRRLVFQGQTPEGDKYEVNYDFGPYEDVEGLRMPLSWFSSQVGTRGNLVEISEVKFNLLMIPEFFDAAEVNIGSVEAAPGRLKGNVLDSGPMPIGLMITTNWTKKDIDAAGLKTGDTLILALGDLSAGIQVELTFFAAAKELPPQNELAKGARILAPLPRGGETYAIQLIGGETSAFASVAKILAPLEIRKK